MSAQTLATWRRPGTPSRIAPERTATRPAWLFIAPFGIFFVLFLIWPVIYMLITSLFDTTLVKPGLGTFIGFGNYAEMLTREDFWEALWHTIQFTHLHGAAVGDLGVRVRGAGQPGGCAGSGSSGWPSSCRSSCRRRRSR